MLKDCPRCYRILTEVPAEGVRVDACPGCGGVWFDAGELPRLAQAGLGALRRLEERWRDSGLAPRRREAGCPLCRKPLSPFTFPHAPAVHLDSCPECHGIWVDEGELAALLDALERKTTPS